ncbi:zinc finger protein 16-like [Helicoverpa zea]|uniref:zinc finger protein 16-like n=1 Tax=Helicoverpa zea TaxID=7113 RepID=UPI001F58CE57|nr:zinc finger protein 16-like [Helicoverpa zea]
MITGEMSETEEEMEIKIEYFETNETDPLSDECTNKSDSKYSATTKHFDENINQPMVNNFNESLNKSPVNDENRFNDISERDEAWHKSIDNFGRYLCKFCEHSYLSKQSLCRHVKLKHVEEYNSIKSSATNKPRRTRLKCHICKKRFKSTSNLQEHLQCHGINDIKNSGSVYHTTLEKDPEILTHITNLVDKIKHLCTKCGYSTSKMSHFKQHEKTHSLKELKKCSYCEYTTYHAHNLKIHEHIHKNHKPYVCSVCDYRSAALSGLYSHRLKHEKEKNMVYCDQCSYSTVYKQSLKKHIESHRRNSVRSKF